MNKIVTLENARQNIGRNVIYYPYENCPKSEIEYGVITSVNDSFVFVRYTRDIHSKATRVENLKY